MTPGNKLQPSNANNGAIIGKHLASCIPLRRGSEARSTCTIRQGERLGSPRKAAAAARGDQHAPPCRNRRTTPWTRFRQSACRGLALWFSLNQHIDSDEEERETRTYTWSHNALTTDSAAINIMHATEIIAHGLMRSLTWRRSCEEVESERLKPLTSAILICHVCSSSRRETSRRHDCAQRYIRHALCGNRGHRAWASAASNTRLSCSRGVFWSLACASRHHSLTVPRMRLAWSEIYYRDTLTGAGRQCTSA